MYKKLITVVAFSASVLISNQQAMALDVPAVNAVKVANGIHMLSAKGGNVGVFIGKDGTFVVDDQFAPLTEKLMAKIKSLGGDTPKFLVNTHFHGDHTGGNENFGKKGAMIVSHDNVRERLKKGYKVAAFNNTTPPAPAAALPVITYSEKMHFHINSEDVNLVHVSNAHTDGDTFIHFKKANVIHAGDLFFNGFYPFIDAGNGGNVKGVIDAANTMLALANNNTKIIPGHGPLARKKDLEAYRNMLQKAYFNLLALKKQGLNSAQAQAKRPLAEFDKDWANGIFTSDKWIDVIYPAVK